MNIIHAHKYFYLRAGAERYMLELMQLQAKAGHQVAPFAMAYPKNDPTPWERFFVSELRTESGVAPGLGALRQLARASWSREADQNMDAMIRAFRPDVVHAHNLYTHLSPSVLKACARHDVPVVMTVHDYALVSANYSLWDRDRPMDVNRLGLLRTARTRFIKGSYAATFLLELIYSMHRTFRMYDRFIHRYIVPSQFVADVLVRHGFAQNKIVVLPHFTKSPAGARATRRDDGSVLFAGRLESYKGVQTLVDAMRAFPNTPLKIAGTGPYERSLRDRAKGMPVEFLGFVRGEALREYMRAARVVVVPSLWHEVFGLVVVEAMACGVPVVVSNAGALPEIVEDGVSGSVFQAGNVEDLVQKLHPLIYDAGYARSMGEAAAKRARIYEDTAGYLKKIMTAYQDIQSV